MGGTTTNGFPYVTPDDHPLQFPAHSQALANKLQAVVAAGADSGWATRASTNTAAAATDASVVAVTVTSAAARKTMVNAMCRWSSTAVSNVTVTLRAGAVTLATYTLFTQPITPEQALHIAWAGTPTSGDFQMIINGSAGTQTVGSGSYIAVAVI